jgi:shikimate kinase
VAKLLETSFVDTDALVTERYGPIPTLFANEGEPSFRVKERDAIEEALGTQGVVALGGGAVMDSRTRTDLAGLRVAMITISPEAVASRLNSDKRPLLAGGLESWVSLVAARQAWYDEVSDQSFDTSVTPLDTVAENIVSWIRGEVA